MTPLFDPYQTRIDYLGPGHSAGPLPAFFYFSLSGEESLHLPPYYQPAQALLGDLVRVFSFTIPGHGPTFNRFDAMQYWADQMAEGHTLLEDFFEKVLKAIQWLVETNWVQEDKLAVGGLSRGAFIATHLAARDKRLTTVLGYAPLTELMRLNEFKEKIEAHPALEAHANSLNLSHLVDNLGHVHHLLFFIGNRDTWVGTDPCFFFIRSLADKAHEKKIRTSQYELKITHSIGRKGHGTHPEIFKEGSEWVKWQLLGTKE